MSEKRAIRERILAYMEDRGLRLTTQRRAIVQAAFGTKEHYTAEQLLERSRKLDPSVSRATVYRTLPLLVESGLLRELDLGKDYKFYDPNYATHPNHNHLVCMDCEKVFEFDDNCLDVRESVVAASMGFRAKVVRLRIEAKCHQLSNEGYCSKSKIRRAKVAPE